MDGTGILTRSFPFLPIISPRLMYLRRSLFTFPRTILRKRCRSRSIFCPTVSRLKGGRGIDKDGTGAGRVRERGPVGVVKDGGSLSRPVQHLWLHLPA